MWLKYQICPLKWIHETSYFHNVFPTIWGLPVVFWLHLLHPIFLQSYNGTRLEHLLHLLLSPWTPSKYFLHNSSKWKRTYKYMHINIRMFPFTAAFSFADFIWEPAHNILNFVSKDEKSVSAVNCVNIKLLISQSVWCHMYRDSVLVKPRSHVQVTCRGHEFGLRWRHMMWRMHLSDKCFFY